MNETARKYLPLAVIAPLAVVLDQWTKYLAVAHLTRGVSSLGQFFGVHHLLGLRGPDVTVTSFWDFRYAENPGAAFSFLAGANDATRVPFFFGVAIVATALISWFYRKSEPHHLLRRVALAMVLGGALGNTLDRIVHGYVVDFILWHYKEHDWPVFNVADSFVCVGVFFLLTENWFTKKKPRAAGETTSAPLRNS